MVPEPEVPGNGVTRYRLDRIEKELSELRIELRRDFEQLGERIERLDYVRIGTYASDQRAFTEALNTVRGIANDARAIAVKIAMAFGSVVVVALVTWLVSAAR